MNIDLVESCWIITNEITWPQYYINVDKEIKNNLKNINLGLLYKIDKIN